MNTRIIIGVVFVLAMLLLTSTLWAQLTPLPPLSPSPNCQQVWVIIQGQGQWITICR
jgi:hypothetical protein